MLAAKADFIDAGEGNLFGLRMSIRLALSDSCFKQIDEHKQYAHAWRYMLIQCLQTGWAGDTCFSYSREFSPPPPPQKTLTCHRETVGEVKNVWEKEEKLNVTGGGSHIPPTSAKDTALALCYPAMSPWLKKKIKKIKRGTCSIHKSECTLQSCAMDSP